MSDALHRITNEIDGAPRPPAGGAYLENVEPATGRVFALIPDSGSDEVDAAVAAAETAFERWSATPAIERSRMLFRIADLIDANREELARIESIDNGKPIALARSVDIPRAAANFRFFAGAVLHWHSEAHPMDGAALNYTLRQPLGVVGAISPWNLPLYLFTWKIAPALAVGNTVVAKPSEVTPMTAARLADLCREAGLPKGVLNIIHGGGATAGDAIVRHPRVAAITFTGGTATGRAIASAAAPMFKKLSLELGGKNPNIIFADADLDRAIPESLRAAFANQGQICLCGSRIYVERPIFDRFVERFVEGACALRIGDPLEESTQQGALVSRPHFEKVRSYIDIARHEGGRILCGGESPPPPNERCANGCFLTPTVITGLDNDSRVQQEEVFGPVVTITPFDGEDEALRLANASQYGLAATIWTRDLPRAHRVAARIQAGIVWINCWMVRDLRTPFGGMKQSGVGREGGEEALRFFTEPRNVCISLES
ncbi:MAG: aldehyde dehydrogenase [Planctomycetota bacterium]|nr:aldehyde dehydrogenase [Planctomycetota bacterium]